MGIHVGVTGLHASDNPAPGIGVIRSLQHPNGWDGEIIGLAYDAMDTGLYDQDLLDHAYLIPYPNQGSDQIFERLIYIHEQIHLDVIIPTLDSELRIFQLLEPRLREAGISLFIPPPETVKRASKADLAEFCIRQDIPVPETVVIRDPNQLDKALRKIGFPLMVKGVFYEAIRCHTRSDAMAALEKLSKKWGYPIILQKVIQAEEFDVCCVGDREGNLMGALPIRKTNLTDKGKAWAAVTLKNETLLELSRKILKGLRWAGPCELEVLQENRTGKYYLIEINPRFPAWIFLCTGAEQNLPKLVVDMALGKKVSPLPPAKSGVTFVRHATDLVCPLDYVGDLSTIGELHYRQSES